MSYAKRFAGVDETYAAFNLGAEADAEIARLRAAHEENARILGFLVNELNGRVENGKLSAVEACRKRATTALNGDEA